MSVITISLVSTKNYVLCYPCFKLRIVGEAGQVHELTPLEAAQRFAEKYLPDFGSSLVSLPEEIVSYDVSQTVGFPGLPQEERAKLKEYNEASIKESVGSDIKVLKDHLEKPVTIDKQKYETLNKQAVAAREAAAAEVEAVGAEAEAAA